MSEKLLGRNCSWCSWATPSETRHNLELCHSCAEHFDDGATNERERIIAILERDADEWYRLGNRHTGNAIKLAIWLIKGENE
jgi:hypothetical protein